MPEKPTYEELEKRVKELEKETVEREQVEEALRESEEKYRTLFKNANEAIYVAQNERIVFANPKTEELYGYSAEQLTSKPFINFIHDKDQKMVLDRHKRQLRDEKLPTTYPFRIVNKAGDTKWVEIKVALFSWDNRPAALCFQTDITERKRAEDALAEERNLLRTIIDNLPDYIYVKDTESRYVVTNNAHARFLGATTPEEVIGKTVFELFPQELAEQYYADDQQVIRSGNSLLNREERSVDETGKRIWNQTTKVPLRDSSGKIVGLVGIARDITKRKKMEEERARLIKKFQKTNKELENSSQELKQTTLQLVQSEKMSALGELTAGVAHELNQPLNGIKIISQSILRDMEKNRFEEDKLGEELTEIVHQVNKMAEIIDHMRVFTRKSEGMPEEMIDLNTVIEGPFKLLNQQLKDHNIEVVTELAPTLPRVMGDPIRLEQVFMNLITNARNAVDSYGEDNKRIEIRTYKVDNRKEVAAEVKDNGGGIPEDLRDKIFQPFFTTTDPGKGTGLGLSVSGKIVEEHRGRIELETEEGKGSTFRVILPIEG